MFRWDAQQRFAAGGHRGWVLVALAAWATVGGLSEVRHRVSTAPENRVAARTMPPASPTASTPRAVPQTSVEPPNGQAPAAVTTPTASSHTSLDPKAAPPEATRPIEKPQALTPTGPITAAKVPPAQGQGAAGEAAPALAAPQVQQPIAATWQTVKLADIDRDLIFNRLPSDMGVVAPIAPADEEPPTDIVQTLDGIRLALPNWGPAKVTDAVQRARNILYIAAVPDVLQTELERFAPYVVFDQLEHDIPKEDLMKVLYWIALHPLEGDDSAIDQLPALGFENRAVDVEQTRERAAIYAVKLLGRLTGAIRGS